jgi:hypothetical protein
MLAPDFQEKIGPEPDDETSTGFSVSREILLDGGRSYYGDMRTLSLTVEAYKLFDGLQI